MDAGNLNQYQAFEPDKDTKAFIYQQVHELENDIAGLGDVSVLIERKEEADVETGEILDIEYAVTFTVDPKETNLKVQATGKDVFDACIEAKKRLQRKLQKIMTTVSAEERNSAIESIMSSNGYLH